MSDTPVSHRVLVILLAVVGAAVPLVLYYAAVGRVPTIEPERAAELITRPQPEAVLVDVRSAAAYRDCHVKAAAHWPAEDIRAAVSPNDVPPALRGKRLLLMCDSGLTSAAAVAHLQSASVEAANVCGGLQGWIPITGDPADPPDDRVRFAKGDKVFSAFRAAPLYEQWAQVISGFGIKYTYMAISAVLIVWLWRRGRARRELRALMWGQVFFLIGEIACSVNYVAFGERSYLTEYVHSYGMLLCFGFTTYAIFEGMDRWLIGFADAEARCAAISLCGRCAKHAPVPCGLRRMFLVIIPATALTALMLPCAGYQLYGYNTRILGTFYTYVHPVVYQVFESRLCPAGGVVLMIASLAVLLVQRAEGVPLAKVLFAAGMGPIGFGMLRTVLLGLYADNLVWLWCWEEITELLFVAALAFVLWIFRKRLLPPRVSHMKPPV